MAGNRSVAGKRKKMAVKQRRRRRQGLKALLADAPLDGVDLERPRDLGRAVDLRANVKK